MANGNIDILLVEDDPMDVRLMLRALAGGPAEGHVEVVRDGEEALDYLFRRGAFSSRPEGERPKLILLDLKLPKVDGLKVLGEVKNDHRTCAIPVAVLTSSREEKDLARSYRLGANSYLQKPFDLNELQETIRTVERYWIELNQSPPDLAFSSN